MVGEDKPVKMCRHHPDRPAVPRRNGRGTMGVCRECIQARSTGRRRNGPQKMASPEPAPEGPKRKRVKKAQNHKIILDFSQHTDILSKLREKAEKEFRTVENQILFYLQTV